MNLNHKNIFNGVYEAPKSKSYAIRAAFAAFLVKRTVVLLDYPKDDDSLSALNIIEQFGGNVHWEEQNVKIHSNGIIIPKEINCGESALCFNFALAIALTTENEIKINGHKSLLTRDLSHIFNNLSYNNIKYSSINSKLPIVIHKNTFSDFFEINASKSSQLASAMIYSQILKPELKLKINQLVSKNYFYLTLEILKNFGFEINQQKNIFQLKQIKSAPNSYAIEADYSGTANLLVAAAINGEVRVNGLNNDSIQSDKEIINILKYCGAYVFFDDAGLFVKSNKLASFNYSIEHSPDLFPILCVLAAFCEGITKISNIDRLKYKESNRALVMQKELQKAGIDFTIENDTAIITGGKVKSANFSSYEDHRIAMALTVLSIFADGVSSIDNIECIKKSFPGFISIFYI